MARRHIREKKKATQADILAELPREKPGQDRVKHGRHWRASDGVTVRVSAELPAAVLRMYKRGTLTAAQCRAAEMFMADWEQGYGSGIATTQFRERVQGGSNSGDEASAGVLDARARYDAAASVCHKNIADVLVGVLINGVILTAAGEYSKRYSRVESRRTCASTLLGVGLSILAEHYGFTKAHNGG